jgi:radical SAM PhpK family P-methyltransferase
MNSPRIAILGPITESPSAIKLPSKPNQVKSLLKTYNFTRVVTEENELVDHISFLKRQVGTPEKDEFSVWEMFGCAGLLLTSHLRRNGFEVKFVNYMDSDNIDREITEVQSFRPDIIAISTTFVLTKNHLAIIGKKLKVAMPEAFIVAGGHHILTTLMYMNAEEKTKYLEMANIDGFIEDSQGELSLLNLCQSYPDGLDSVSNLVWRQPNGEIRHNERQPEDNDINSTLIEIGPEFKDTVVHIRTARSCAFKCAFCSYPTIAGDLALMDLDNVIETLKQAKRSGVKSIFFIDDTFNVPRDRFEALVDRMIEEDIGLPWYSFLRCQHVDEDLIKRMKKSGCAGVFLGIESGSDAILKNMKKGAVAGFYRDGIKWLREQEIVTVGAFLIGFPGETEETVKETFEFIQNVGLDYYYIQPFYFLHHTPVYKRAEEFGLTGDGLFWSHDTMKWTEAVNHINRLFLEIDGSIFVNPDYTLWEIAYLQSKGMSLDEIKNYRILINDMTQRQMTTYGLVQGSVTSRA